MGRLTITLLLAATAYAQSTAAFKPGAIRVLILSGRNNHDWRATTPALRKLLVDSGRFDVRITEEAAGVSAETLVSYDVLVLDYCGPRWSSTTEKAVADFVRNGKGLVAYHAASYPFGEAEILGDPQSSTGMYESPWPEYKVMIGAWWDRRNAPTSGHGARHRFTVRFIDRDHPVSRGLPETFEADDELYHSLRLMPGIHVLATAFDAKELRGTGNDQPIIWTLSYGKGRVFHTALGHDTKAIAQPGFAASFVSGAEWVARGTVR